MTNDKGGPYIVVTVDNVVQGGGDLDFARRLVQEQGPDTHAQIYVSLDAAVLYLDERVSQ